ncbi:hypothetical protein HUU05_18930 [candidate division KSB1 bacterium]|nr:hypothetical protein [candidate division KSB1 bacterium]
MNIFEQKNSQLVTEFDRYVQQHPQFTEVIPKGAVVVMQLQGDEPFNEWSRQVAQRQAEPGQAIVFVRIKKLRPIQSRIEELEIAA